MENIELMAKQLKAVGDPNRLKLFACLKKGEVCACDFVGVLNISQPAVSQQLKKLKEAGIILERPAGTWKHYRLNDQQPPYIQAIIDQLEVISIIKCDCYSCYWAVSRSSSPYCSCGCSLALGKEIFSSHYPIINEGENSNV